MNNILAEFISPIVSDLHHSDPTINQPHYDMPQNTNTPRFDEIFTDYVITKLKLISSGTTTNLSELESQRKQLNRQRHHHVFFRSTAKSATAWMASSASSRKKQAEMFMKSASFLSLHRLNIVRAFLPKTLLISITCRSQPCGSIKSNILESW